PRSRAPAGAMSPRRLVTANRLRRARTSRSTSPDSGRVSASLPGASSTDRICELAIAIREVAFVRAVRARAAVDGLVVDRQAIGDHALAAEAALGLLAAALTIQPAHL